MTLHDSKYKQSQNLKRPFIICYTWRKRVSIVTGSIQYSCVTKMLVFWLIFVPMGLVKSKSALVYVMVWRWTGDKTLHYVMLTKNYDAVSHQWRKGAEWGYFITVLKGIIIPDNWTFVISSLWYYYTFTLYHGAMEPKYFHKWGTYTPDQQYGLISGAVGNKRRVLFQSCHVVTSLVAQGSGTVDDTDTERMCWLSPPHVPMVHFIYGWTMSKRITLVTSSIIGWDHAQPWMTNRPTSQHSLLLKTG